MDWASERYVKLYTRETVEVALWPWQSRALWPWLLARCDRNGRLEFGRHGRPGFAVLVKLPPEVVEAGLDGLLLDGCVTERHDSHGFVTLDVINFVEAQDTRSKALSPAERQAAKRARDRDENAKPAESLGARHGCHDRHAPVTNVTPSSLPPEPPATEAGALSAAAPLLLSLEPPKDPGPLPRDLQSAWNANAPPLPKWQAMTDARATHARTLLRAHGLPGLVAVIERIAASSFCLGQNSRKWKADPEWFLKADSIAKVMEGKYDDDAPPAASAAPTTRHPQSYDEIVRYEAGRSNAELEAAEYAEYQALADEAKARRAAGAA